MTGFFQKVTGFSQYGWILPHGLPFIFLYLPNGFGTTRSPGLVFFLIKSYTKKIFFSFAGLMLECYVLPQFDLVIHFSGKNCTEKLTFLQSLYFVIMHHIYIFKIYLTIFYYDLQFYIISILQF